jgi:hypothetical protein
MAARRVAKLSGSRLDSNCYQASLNRSVSFPKVIGAVERELPDRTLYLRNQESTVLWRTLFPPQNPRR